MGPARTSLPSALLRPHTRAPVPLRPDKSLLLLRAPPAPSARPVCTVAYSPAPRRSSPRGLLDSPPRRSNTSCLPSARTGSALALLRQPHTPLPLASGSAPRPPDSPPPLSPAPPSAPAI